MATKKIDFFSPALICLSIFLSFFSCENDHENEVKRSFNSLVLNELCCEIAKEWIELKNTSSVELDIGGVSLVWENADERKQLLYTFPDQTLLAAKSYVVLDKTDHTLTADILLSPDVAFTISLVSPYNETVDIFDRDKEVGANVIHPLNGSYARIPDGASWWESTRSPTKGASNVNVDPRTFNGLLLNEVCCTSNAEWIEIKNISDETMDIGGIKVGYKNDQNVEMTYYVIPENTLLHADSFLILDKAVGTLSGSFPMNQKMVVSLVSPQNTVIDVFDRDMEIGVNISHYQKGSFARIPDGADGWKNTLIATKGAENIYMESVDMSAQNGIWMWGSHFNPTGIETFQMLKEHGIGNVIVNQTVMTDGYMTESDFRKKADQIRALGIKVHLWFVCFNDGGWINPIILDQQTGQHIYDQVYFDNLIQKAAHYAQFGNIDGIHLDYIRYPGTAYKYNYSGEGNDVTGENAVTEFCRQISTAVKAIDPNIVMSAALMPETSSNAYYYGQNARKMCKYIDILMPMVYRYNYNSSANWIFTTSHWFASEVQAATDSDPTIHSEVWTGLQTYSGDNNVINLSVTDLETDCRYAIKSPAGTLSGATGIVLFRFGLVNYFDLSSVYY